MRQPVWSDTTNLLKRVVLIILLHIGSMLSIDTADAQINDEIKAALKRFPSLEIVSIKKATGKVELLKSKGLTSDDLKGISLQDHPPVLKRKLDYSEDTYEKPYLADGIGPFRLNQFNCNFNYGGHNNYQMQDYACTHGFNTIYPYRRTPEQISVLPTDTKIASWSGISKYRKTWWQDQQLPEARYDLLNSDQFLTQPSEIQDRSPKQFDSYMLDMEHTPPLETETLKKQTWYPKTNREEFEKRYYAGFQKSLTSTVNAYRQQGFENLGIYGWSPLERGWYPLLANTPLPREPWELYGKSVSDSVDVIHNSAYCPYADSKNVAYVLASIEENVRRAKELDNPKPVRPYFWPLISGGGGGDRWWQEVPHLNEDQEAMIAMAFFLDIDGLVVWNWSGRSSHHVASFETFMGTPAKRSLMVAKPFNTDDTSGQNHEFRRYDYLHVQDTKNGVLSFQKIHPEDKKNDYGISPKQPIYRVEFKSLIPFLRARSEPISAVIRGMALVKPFEASIRKGTPQKDFNSRDIFRENLPVYRRVKTGSYHLIITYDPQTIRTGKESKIVVKDFDGNKDLDLVFPADQHPRIFIVSE